MRRAVSLYALAIARVALAASSTLFATTDSGTTLLTLDDADKKVSLIAGSTVQAAAGSRLIVVNGAVYVLNVGTGANTIANVLSFKTDASGALTQLAPAVATGGVGARDLQISPDGSTLVRGRARGQG